MEFKDRFKYLRKQRRLSQTQIAIDLKVSKSLVGLYETGKRKPTADGLQEIADYFNVTLDYLVGKEDVSMYYFAPEIGMVAQAMREQPRLKKLFLTIYELPKEDFELIVLFVERLSK